MVRLCRCDSNYLAMEEHIHQQQHGQQCTEVAATGALSLDSLAQVIGQAQNELNLGFAFELEYGF